MNKKQILSSFLKEDILLKPEQLEKINKNNYKEFLVSLKGEEKNSKTKIPKQREEKKTSTIKETLEQHERKYNFLKNILLKKMEAVSINKGKKIYSKTSVIGRIKDKTPRGFIIEDITGEVEIFTDNEEVKTGDVLGMVGWFKEGGFLAEKIVWPDIPLTNETTEIQDIVVSANATEKVKKEAGSDKTIITLKKDVTRNIVEEMTASCEDKELFFLVISHEKEIREEEVTSFLKSRVINIKNNANPFYLIEKVPDIVWILKNKENWTKNYKGVMVVSTKEKSFYVYKKNEGGTFLEM